MGSRKREQRGGGGGSALTAGIRRSRGNGFVPSQPHEDPDVLVKRALQQQDTLTAGERRVMAETVSTDGYLQTAACASACV